jgi:hypothetical protein
MDSTPVSFNPGALWVMLSDEVCPSRNITKPCCEGIIWLTVPSAFAIAVCIIKAQIMLNTTLADLKVFLAFSLLFILTLLLL